MNQDVEPLVALGAPSAFDWVRIKQTALYGSIPYTELDLVVKREAMEDELRQLFEELQQSGLTHDQILEQFHPDRLADARAEPVEDDPSRHECCSPDDLAKQLALIKAVYRHLVHVTWSHLGCITWSERVHETLRQYLVPNERRCWRARYVWRATVSPFGHVFPSDRCDIFVHHAFAICPCTVTEGCTDDCLVLDPYTKTGIGALQFAHIYTLKEWMDGYQVTYCSEDEEINQESIYLRIAQHYTGRSSCRLVLQCIKNEWRSHLRWAGGMSDDAFERTWRDSPLSSVDCG